MRLPRWLLVSLIVVSVVALVAVPAWLWIEMPERIADRFIVAIPVTVIQPISSSELKNDIALIVVRRGVISILDWPRLLRCDHHTRLRHQQPDFMNNELADVAHVAFLLTLAECGEQRSREPRAGLLGDVLPTSN